MKFLKNNKGFTLIEMVSVILVLGIISAVAIPMFDQSTINATLVANTVQTDIQYTQELAMTRGDQSPDPDIGITFTPGASFYKLPVDPGGVWSDDTRNLPQGVTIKTVAPNQPIRFNKHGETSTGGTVVTLTAGGIDVTITVAGYTGKVTVP